MLARQLHLAPTLHAARPCCSKLVCLAGKGKKHKAQKPKQRKYKGTEGASSSFGSGLGGYRPSNREWERAKARVVDQRVALFHEEFEAAVKKGDMGLSAGQAAAVQHKVDAAWSTAHLMPLSQEAMFSDDFDAAIGMASLVMRLGHRASDPGFMSLPPRTVFMKQDSLPYDPFSQNFQSFANTPCEGVHLLPGTTHVAVGFADLGELAAAVSRWGPTVAGQLAAFPLEFDEGRRDAAANEADMAAFIQQFELGEERASKAAFDHRVEEAVGAHAVLQVMKRAHDINASNADAATFASSSSRSRKAAAAAVAVTGAAGQPLLWVGYDASPYAVAKAVVLLEMMKQGAHTDAVLQVWYSSCWSLATKKAFDAALQTVLDSCANTTGGNTSSSRAASAPQQPAHSRDVLRLLQHWRQQPEVSLDQSRSSWLQRQQQIRAFIGGFTRKQDRLALTRYLFTGELLAADVGSTVMCCLPDGCGSMAADENFLEAIRTSTLFRAWKLQQYPDIVAAGVSVLRRRIKRLGELIRDGHVIAEVRHEMVNADKQDLLSAIQLLQPLTMSWSNVPDYWEAEEFHKTAQQCSARVTVHFMHSMNWVREVKGACWVDWTLTRLAAQKEGEWQAARACEELAREGIKKASDQIHSSYAAQGVAGKLLLTRPTVDNPRNVLDAVLYGAMFEEWQDAFVMMAEEVADCKPPPAWIAKAVLQSVPDVMRSADSGDEDDDFEASDYDNDLDADDVPYTLSITLGAPGYGPLTRTSATMDLALVQYGDDCLSHGGAS